MKKLQAAMRDRAAKSWRERKHMFKVGGPFKGCCNCGEFEWRERGGREVKWYLSGFQVFRSYQPSAVGWTWWCWQCGAKDLACWEESEWVLAQLGKPPIGGSGDAKAKAKEYMLLEREAAIGKVKPEPREVIKDPEIAKIEAEIRKIEEMLKGGKA